MKKILILQSSAKGVPQWIRQCQRSVEEWCVLNRYAYIHFGDAMFDFVSEYDKPFTKIQRSDLGRIRLMESHLCLGHYDAVYWLDSDFLIWNIYEFKLPMPTPGAVVCAREAHHTPNGTTIMLNNSVLGFCRREDARVLSDLTAATLDEWKGGDITPPHIIAGPMVLSKPRFPLRKIIAKQAGCFSDVTINKILGPWLAGRTHLWWLSLAGGATLRAANLCSSRRTSNDTMEALVADLVVGFDHELGGWANFSGIYRAWLEARNFPFRVKCWTQTRARRIRKSLIPV